MTPNEVLKSLIDEIADAAHAAIDRWKDRLAAQALGAAGPASPPAAPSPPPARPRGKAPAPPAAAAKPRERIAPPPAGKAIVGRGGVEYVRRTPEQVAADVEVVLQQIKATPGLTTEKLVPLLRDAGHAHFTTRSIKKPLEKLRRDGRVVTSGTKKGTKYFVAGAPGAPTPAPRLAKAKKTAAAAHAKRPAKKRA